MTTTLDTNIQEAALERANRILDHLMPADPVQQPAWYQTVLDKIPKDQYKSQPKQATGWFSWLRSPSLMPHVDLHWWNNAWKHSYNFMNQMFTWTKVMQMPAVSIVAAYLQSKNGVQGLYVCSSLEAMKQKLEEISRTPGNVRAALIVSASLDVIKKDMFGTEAIHKVAICVEKTDASMKIAVMESLGVNTRALDPHFLTAQDPESSLYDEEADEYDDAPFANEYILWYICHSALDLNKTKIYLSSVRRQHAVYGCETFALRDGIAFLKDPQFYDKIQTQRFTVSDDDKSMELEDITDLPPAFMKGAQSRKVLSEYDDKYLNPTGAATTPAAEDLRRHVNKYTIPLNGHLVNRSNTVKAHKYHLFVLKVLETMKTKEIQKIMSQTLVTAYPPKSK